MSDINETIDRIARLAFDNAVDPDDGSTCTSAVNKYAHGVVMAALRYAAREARNEALKETGTPDDIDTHEKPRYTTRRLHYEIDKAKKQGRNEAFEEAARIALEKREKWNNAAGKLSRDGLDKAADATEGMALGAEIVFQAIRAKVTP